jgi:hypothetical protein
MATITRFEDIEAWKSARQLTRMIYAFTEQSKIATDKSSRQIARFMSYLESHPQFHRVRDEGAEYEV